MVKILKACVFLSLIGFAGLTGYAYLGDLTPRTSLTSQEIKINVD